MNDQLTGPERARFAGILLAIGGVLNVIYGIAGTGNSRVFASSRHYLFAGLKSWGWTTLILGVLEILAALSLLRGGSFGRWFGIIIGSLAAIAPCSGCPPTRCGRWRSSRSASGSSRA